MSIDNQIFKLSCDLYRNLKLSKCTVQFIIECLDDFIKTTYNPALLENLKTKLENAISEECMNAIEKTMTDLEHSFDPYNTEQKRLTIYKNKGIYIEPIQTEISRKTVIKLKDEKVFIGTKPIKKVHISLEDSLNTIFKIEGLFEATLKNLHYLESEKKLKLNLISGSNWEEDKAAFIQEHGPNKILMPFLVYFDDFVPRGPLSAHSGNNQLGTVYSTVPCFPTSFASKLLSIIVSDLFYSKDRKEYGTEAILSELIEDLSNLRDKGVNLLIKGRKVKVYFTTSLVIGDNLGINSLLGFIESFSNSMFCRVCYITPEESKVLVKEKESLLRTVDKYEEDLQKLNPSATGVKKPCPFNILKMFHCIKKSCLDITHDGPEGFFSYDMAEITIELCEQGEISIELINMAIRSKDFGFEKNNLPMDISLNYLKAHRKLKMSASESTFFTRYFHVMVSEHVSEGNKVWDFYIVLRKIVHIITAPILTDALLEELEELIEDHHRRYIKLFGDLKPKHHLLTHYVRIMRQNGPIVHLSTIRFESKHREIKAIINATASNTELPLIVGSRIQLSMMDISSLKYEENYVSFGKEVHIDDDLNIHFPLEKDKKRLKKVTVNGFDYADGSVIIVKIRVSGPQFAKVDKIFCVNGKVWFRYIPMIVIGFNSHHFGHSAILDLNDRDLVMYEELPCKTPCISFRANGRMFITTRHVIV